MKALFLVFYGLESYNGISKKILYQVSALNQLGVSTELCYTDFDEYGNQIRKVDSREICNYGNGFVSKIKKRIDFSSVSNYIISNNIDFLYIRSAHNASPFLSRMVKSIKKARNVKVVVEIPTYPYQGQFKGASFEAKLSLFLDIIFRKSFSKLIDSYVTFTDDNTIFGAPNISISNGIDFDSIKLREKSHRVLDKSNPSNSFYLISVSEVHYWHGIDRVIEGLSKYYSNPNNKMSVFFMIIGRGFGSEYNDLMLLARKRGLDGYITFYGNRSGEELNKLFEMADFGVASLARHRSNITKIKTLKNREYAARGIPFIYSEIDDDFEGMPYIMKATPDDTPLDICSIIDFYNKCDYSPLQIRNSIIDTLSWREQMKKVIKVI